MPPSTPLPPVGGTSCVADMGRVIDDFDARAITRAIETAERAIAALNNRLSRAQAGHRWYLELRLAKHRRRLAILQAGDEPSMGWVNAVTADMRNDARKNEELSDG